MGVILYLGLADVTHLGSTCAGHLVAAILFEELREKRVTLLWNSNLIPSCCISHTP